MAKTLDSKVVGHCMGNQIHFRSGGLPHLQLEILGPLVSRLVLKPELEMHCEKGQFHRIWGFPIQLGFGFCVVLAHYQSYSPTQKYSYTCYAKVFVHPPLWAPMHQFESWVVALYRGEFGQNINWPSCWVLHGEPKSL